MSPTPQAPVLAGVSFSSLIKGVQAFTLAHPVMILGTIGAAVLLIGAADAVKARRQAAPSSDQAGTPA